jgi:hypothetical protein
MDQRALDLLSAALRHVRDAEHLTSALELDRSIDQAYHLAAFGPECARKAALSRRTFDRAIAHGVSGMSDTALAFALAMDPSARRFDLEGWSPRYPSLGAWSEGARYEATGTRTAAEVNALLRESREIVDRLVFALWADGLVPGAFSW